MLNSRVLSIVALLVEDNAADAELIAARLDAVAGAPRVGALQVFHVCSVSAACAIMAIMPFDVVILDLTLPDAHGLEALFRVRESAPALPVVVLSGIADQEIAIQALRAGAQDYVLKPPPDGATLSRIVSYSCERHRLIKDLDAARVASASAALRWRLLAEVAGAFSRADHPPVAMAEVAQLLVPDAADCFALVVAGDRGLPALVQVTHVDGVRDPATCSRIAAMLSDPASAVNQLLADSDASTETLGSRIDVALQPVLASLGGCSGTALPVRFGGRIRGFMLLSLITERIDAAVDYEFGRSLADCIGMALGHDRLLRETQDAVSARDRAVSIVSHDLRNPLSTIQICATALLDPLPAQTSGVRHMATLIQRSADWMQHIVQDLLDRATLDAGCLTLRRTQVTSAHLMSALENLFEQIAEEKSVALTFSSEPLLEIHADGDRLLQALSNLVGNAVKFTPAGGRVEVSALADESALDVFGMQSVASVRFTVRDTGPGIAPEDLIHVFDWFWRAPGGGGTGAGLGLAITKGLIEAHGGQLHVDTAPGVGSTFWFALPTRAGIPSAQPPLEVAL